jgi:hypothetical protein
LQLAHLEIIKHGTRAYRILPSYGKELSAQKDNMECGNFFSLSCKEVIFNIKHTLESTRDKQASEQSYAENNIRKSY